MSNALQNYPPWRITDLIIFSLYQNRCYPFKKKSVDIVFFLFFLICGNGVRFAHGLGRIITCENLPDMMCLRLDFRCQSDDERRISRCARGFAIAQHFSENQRGDYSVEYDIAGTLPGSYQIEAVFGSCLVIALFVRPFLQCSASSQPADTGNSNTA